MAINWSLLGRTAPENRDSRAAFTQAGGDYPDRMQLRGRNQATATHLQDNATDGAILATNGASGPTPSPLPGGTSLDLEVRDAAIADECQ
jgi:hypothetical protein